MPPRPSSRTSSKCCRRVPASPSASGEAVVPVAALDQDGFVERSAALFSVAHAARIPARHKMRQTYQRSVLLGREPAPAGGGGGGGAGGGGATAGAGAIARPAVLSRGDMVALSGLRTATSSARPARLFGGWRWLHRRRGDRLCRARRCGGRSKFWNRLRFGRRRRGGWGAGGRLDRGWLGGGSGDEQGDAKPDRGQANDAGNRDSGASLGAEIDVDLHVGRLARGVAESRGLLEARRRNKGRFGRRLGGPPVLPWRNGHWRGRGHGPVKGHRGPGWARGTHVRQDRGRCPR